MLFIEAGLLGHVCRGGCLPRTLIGLLFDDILHEIISYWHGIKNQLSIGTLPNDGSDCTIYEDELIHAN